MPLSECLVEWAVSADFATAMNRLSAGDLVTVRDQIRAWCNDRYQDGLRDGERRCLSRIWGLDPDSAECAQMISELAAPVPDVQRHRLDRAPAEQLSPNRDKWNGVAA